MMRGGGLQALAGAPEQQAQQRGATLGRLLGEFVPYRSALLGTLGLIVVGAAAQALGPYLISRAIDQNIANRDAAGLAQTMALLFVVYVIGALVSRSQSVQIGTIGQKILAGLRERIFKQLQHLPLGYFDRRPLGDLISRVSNDVDTLNQLLGQGLTQLLGSLLALVGIVIAMLVLNWRLALVSFITIPIMIIVTIVFAERSRAAFLAARQTTGDITAGLQEEITGVREAQAFNRAEENIERFEQRNAANRDANIQAVTLSSAFAPSIDVLSTLATALVIGYGGYLVFNNQLTVGVLAAFLIYVQQFFRPIQLASQVYVQLQAALAGGERIYAILDERREPTDAPTAQTLANVAGQITFTDVTFAYEAGHDVLHGITFVAEPGQTIALVGSTGSGKTTIVNLIPRFYDVSGGSVAIDGHDVREVARSSLRAQMAMVLQEPFVFSSTIADNIGFGKAWASRAAIEAAARIVDANGFIAALPQGYDTILGGDGGTLSQGQRQLLTFARAVLADPRILILDEATSAIDTQTEALIQQALATLLRGRTSVVIAHRLSTIRNADLILVIEAGQIVERGSHDQLLERNERYAELYERQNAATPPSTSKR